MKKILSLLLTATIFCTSALCQQLKTYSGEFPYGKTYGYMLDATAKYTYYTNDDDERIYQGNYEMKIQADDKITQESQADIPSEPTANKKDNSKVYVAVEVPAEFPGGQAALMKWISQNIMYPELAKKNYIQGRVVVKFIVEKDGSISDASVTKGIDKDLDNEALRLIKSMPNWNPGKNNGEPVRSYYNLPVTFRL